MDRNVVYILNPCYYLHHDVKRSQIGAYSDPEYTHIKYSNLLVNIHPLVAQMLSVFDGKRTLQQCIDVLVAHLGLSVEEVEEVLGHYIENSHNVADEDPSTRVNAPENVLIPKGDYERREYYNMEEFPVPETLDMEYMRNYKPVSAMLELTMHCYTDCIYCYANRTKRQTMTELTTEQWIDVVHQLKKYDVKEFDINGGEVLLRPDIKPLLIEMKRCGYFPFISTKYPVADEMLQFLKSIGIKRVQVSIDSLHPQTLSTLLNVGPSYFEKIDRTMHTLDKLGFDWRTNTILTKFNSDLEKDIKPLLEYLTSFSNIKKISFGDAGYSLYKSNEHYQQIKVPLDDVKRIATYMQEEIVGRYPNIRFRLPDPQENTMFDCKNFAEFQERAMCTGNQRTFIILPDGKVTICEELYWHPAFIIGDVHDNTIEEIWTGEKAVGLFNIAQDMISEGSPCKTCGSFTACRRPRGVCWKMILKGYGMEHWDYPDPRCPMAPPLKNVIYLE